MVEVAAKGEQDRLSWYRGPICATVVLGESVVAACGRTLLVFDLATNTLKLE